jgi:hypothetical protein
MKRFLWVVWLVWLAIIGAVAAPIGCSGADDGSEPLGTIASPIENGKPINNGVDPVSSMFPRSTVMVRTPLLNDAGAPTFTDAGRPRGSQCTGEIIGPDRILTAAHCLPNSQTQIYLYPTDVDGGSTPIDGGNIPAIPLAGNPAFPPGIQPDEHKPNVTFLSGGVYADMAVLTLGYPVPSNYAKVVLGRPGPDAYEATRTSSSWAVGAGLMNLFSLGHCDAGANPAIKNRSHQMMWTPVDPLNPLDASADFGEFTVLSQTDPGDSGGPIYQLATEADGGLCPVGPDSFNLVLIGILSQGPCGPVGSDIYTNVTNQTNSTWLVNQGATVESPTDCSTTSTAGTDDAFGEAGAGGISLGNPSAANGATGSAATSFGEGPATGGASCAMARRAPNGWMAAGALALIPLALTVRRKRRASR